MRQQLCSGSFLLESRGKVNWRRMSLLEILQSRFGKEVSILDDRIYIFDLGFWDDVVQLYRQSYHWRQQKWPELITTLTWCEHGDPQRPAFEGYAFCGLIFTPLPEEVMWAAMVPTGWKAFPFPWFVGDGYMYLRKQKKVPHPGFYQGQEYQGHCMMFVDMGFGLAPKTSRRKDAGE
ncbi:hypothetical protein HY629_02095 [Candidatus Uhrbacteria bacterium]|nr:hypothetical protein [Candidatus Uhrbacteria bacterium]